MRFDDIVAAHIGWIARQAFTLCRDKADADDLAQDTLLRILSNRDKYDMTRDFKPWALAVMTNIFLSQAARRSRSPLADGIDCREPLTHAADEPTVFRDTLKALRRTSKMSVSVRSVLLYAKGYRYDEIAVMEGIGIGTVKSRIATGRRLIRESLNKR